MRIVDLFVIRTREPRGVFTAPESVSSFPVAVCVIATISRAMETVWRTESTSLLTPFVAALTTSVAITVVTVADADARPRTVTDWIVAILSAIMNSLVLFAAAIGIEKF